MAFRRTRNESASDDEVVASFFSEHGRAALVDPDLDRHLGEVARIEGIDHDLVADSRALLSEWTHDLVATHAATDLAERRAARDRLLYAKLHLEVGRPERAEQAALEALSISPNDRAARTVLAAIRHRQGRLTEAIRIWRTLAEERATEPSTVRVLGRILELAMRKRAGELAFAMPGDLPRVVPALEEFEHAFELALSHDLLGALRRVDRMMERWRGKEAALYKLAALQRAWLLEQMGDIADAIYTLERLADEPGLTQDVERLLALSALYEREGSPHRLRRAIRVVRHAFLATHDPILLRRLARLLDRIGYRRLGELFEARYREAFRRRMHDLTLRELVRAASSVYVPLARLCALRYPVRSVETLLRRHAGRARAVHRRRAAILHLLLGDRVSARDLHRDLERTGRATSTDLQYLGELEADLGDEEASRAPLLRAMRSETDIDGELVTRLGEEVIEALGSRLHAARHAVYSYVRAHPSDFRAWDMLARLDREVGNDAVAERHEQRAREVREGAIDRRRIGRVLGAAAFRHAGDLRGVIHELWVTSRKVKSGSGGDLEDVLGGVTPDLRHEARNVFHAVRAWALARLSIDTSDHRFTLKMTKEDEPSSGNSAGLPIAIALVSMFARVPIPADVAFSGAIVTDAHDAIAVRRVGDVDAKMEGAYERRLRMLVLPAENRDDVERAERVPREVAAGLVRFVDSLDEAIEAVLGADVFLRL